MFIQYICWLDFPHMTVLQIGPPLHDMGHHDFSLLRNSISFFQSRPPLSPRGQEALQICVMEVLLLPSNFCSSYLLSWKGGFANDPNMQCWKAIYYLLTCRWSTKRCTDPSGAAGQCLGARATPHAGVSWLCQSMTASVRIVSMTGIWDMGPSAP